MLPTVALQSQAPNTLLEMLMDLLQSVQQVRAVHQILLDVVVPPAVLLVLLGLLITSWLPGIHCGLKASFSLALEACDLLPEGVDCQRA